MIDILLHRRHRFSGEKEHRLLFVEKPKGNENAETKPEGTETVNSPEAKNLTPVQQKRVKDAETRAARMKENAAKAEREAAELKAKFEKQNKPTPPKPTAPEGPKPGPDASKPGPESEKPTPTTNESFDTFQLGDIPADVKAQLNEGEQKALKEVFDAFNKLSAEALSLPIIDLQGNFDPSKIDEALATAPDGLKDKISDLKKVVDGLTSEQKLAFKKFSELRDGAGPEGPKSEPESKEPKNEFGRMMDDFNGLKKDQETALKQRDDAQAVLDRKDPPPTPEEKEKAEADIKASNDKLREISDKKFQIAMEFIVKLLTDPKGLFAKLAGSPEDPNKPQDPNAPAGGPAGSPDKQNPLRDQIVAKGFQSPTELRDSVSKAEGDANKTLNDKSRDLKAAETGLDESTSKQGKKNDEVNALKKSLASAPSDDAKKTIQANLDAATAELKALDENVNKQTETVKQLKAEVEQAQKAVTQLQEDREKLDSLVTMTTELEKDFGPISISLDADGGASLRFEDATKSGKAKDTILKKTGQQMGADGVIKLTAGGIRVMEANVTGTAKPPEKPKPPEGSTEGLSEADLQRIQQLMNETLQQLKAKKIEAAGPGAQDIIASAPEGSLALWVTDALGLTNSVEDRRSKQLDAKRFDNLGARLVKEVANAKTMPEKINAINDVRQAIGMHIV